MKWFKVRTHKCLVKVWDRLKLLKTEMRNSGLSKEANSSIKDWQAKHRAITLNIPASF